MKRLVVIGLLLAALGCNTDSVTGPTPEPETSEVATEEVSILPGPANSPPDYTLESGSTGTIAKNGTFSVQNGTDIQNDYFGCSYKIYAGGRQVLFGTRRIVVPAGGTGNDKVDVPECHAQLDLSGNECPANARFGPALLDANYTNKGKVCTDCPSEEPVITYGEYGEWGKCDGVEALTDEPQTCDSTTTETLCRYRDKFQQICENPKELIGTDEDKKTTTTETKGTNITEWTAKNKSSGESIYKNLDMFVTTDAGGNNVVESFSLSQYDPSTKAPKYVFRGYEGQTLYLYTNDPIWEWQNIYETHYKYGRYLTNTFENACKSQGGSWSSRYCIFPTYQGKTWSGFSDGSWAKGYTEVQVKVGRERVITGTKKKKLDSAKACDVFKPLCHSAGSLNVKCWCEYPN